MRAGGAAAVGGFNRSVRHGRKRWRVEIEKVEQMRGGYLGQQAEGVITMGELKSKIADLQERREIAERELEEVSRHQERVAKL